MRRPLWQALPTIVGQFAAYGLALILFTAAAAQPEPTGQYPPGYSFGQSGDRP